MIRHDRNLILIGATSWLVLISAAFFGRHYRPSYEFPRNVGTLDMLVGVASLAGTIALKIWLDAHVITRSQLVQNPDFTQNPTLRLKACKRLLTAAMPGSHFLGREVLNFDQAINHRPSSESN